MKPTLTLPLATALLLLLADGVLSAVAPRVLADFDADGPGAPTAEAFARAPSTATVRRVPEGRGHALEISGRSVPPGLAGVRVLFFDVDAERPEYADGTRYFYMTFRIRSSGDPTRVQIKMTDSVGVARDEGVDAGELTRYLPEGLSNDWQQVAVPLGSFGMNRKGLASLILVVLDPGDFVLAIDDVALKRDPEDALPPPKRKRGVP